MNYLSNSELNSWLQSFFAMSFKPDWTFDGWNIYDTTRELNRMVANLYYLVSHFYSNVITANLLLVYKSSEKKLMWTGEMYWVLQNVPNETWGITKINDRYDFADSYPALVNL